MGCVAWMERPPLAAAQSGVALPQDETLIPDYGTAKRRSLHPGYVSYALALGDLVRSVAGHCSEMSGSGVSLPVMRSGTMA